MYGHHSYEPRLDLARQHIEGLLREAEIERRHHMLRAARREAVGRNTVSKQRHAWWRNLPLVARMLNKGQVAPALP